MKDALIQLIDQLDEKSVVTQPDEMERYLSDLLGGTFTRPVAILRPTSTSDVATAVKWCVKHKLKIIPQGGLTGLCHAAIPPDQEPSVILSLGRMNKIRNIDSFDNSMTVDAGVILADIRSAAEEVDRYFPLTHGAVGSSQIGGNLSTNSGGNNAIRYGTARDQVLGLEVVLPDGSVWNGLRQLRKNTAGYDLKHLFIGAEGTLGIITAAVLKLRSYPHMRATALVAVKNPNAALELLRDLETFVGETISAFELLSGSALSFALQMDNARYPMETMHVWNVLIEVETSARTFNLHEALESGLGDAFDKQIIQDAVVAQSTAQRDAMWFLRESIATYFIENKSSIKSDTAVPISKIPEYISNTQKKLTDLMPDIRTAPFGHLGDGNIHFNVVGPENMSGEKFLAQQNSIVLIIESEALKLGGTISAEHGVGRLKRENFLKVTDKLEIALMENLKIALDREKTMNPDVIV